MSIALLALGDWPVKSFEGSKGKMHNLSKSIINRPLEKKNYMKWGFFEKKNFKI